MAELVICSVSGCSKHARARGYCSLHYRRWRRLGTTELDSYRRKSQRFFFEVAMKSSGGIETPCVLWPFPLGKNGYGRVAYECKTYNTHRLACILKKGPPPTPKHQAAHLCGVKHCCHPGHIIWATVAENHSHKIIHGTHLRGERQNGAVLTEDAVRQIRQLIGTMQQKEIAAMFGVARSVIYNIQYKKAWKWLDD